MIIKFKKKNTLPLSCIQVIQHCPLSNIVYECVENAIKNAKKNFVYI